MFHALLPMGWGVGGAPPRGAMIQIPRHIPTSSLIAVKLVVEDVIYVLIKEMARKALN